MIPPSNSGIYPARQKWTEVKPSAPCPVCKKGSWCRVSPDAAIVACRRVSWGGREHTYSGGDTVYIHRLDALQQLPPPPLPSTRTHVPPAPPTLLDAAYGALLARLTLAPSHRDNLRRRGLDDAAIDHGGYRSLPVTGRARLARELRERLGEQVLQVPGVVTREGERGPYLSLAGPAGLLVPVRDLEGRIIGLKIRLDDPGDGPKYLYVSSTKYGGPGPGSPAHVPMGTPCPSALVRITEGELKADIAYQLSGVPTLSIPGAANWQPVLPLLEQLQARTIRLSWDQDWHQKDEVARGLLACGRMLQAKGYEIEIETWEVGKGIDDALLAQKGGGQ